MTTTSRIDTRNVTDHRRLRFNAPADLRADIDRIVAADRTGVLRRTGNWTSGQTFGHLAAWIDFAFDGYPPNVRAPWFIKLLLKLRKNAFMAGPLPRGVKIPRLEGGTLATEPLDLDEGLRRLTRSWDRLESSAPTHPNPIFGHLSHDEWIRFHLRHAELHLGYLHPA